MNTQLALSSFSNSNIANQQIDSDIFERHQKAKDDLIEFMELVNTRFKTSLSYLVKAGKIQGNSSIFCLNSGLKVIDSEYWDLVLKETNVKEFMSYDRRLEWWENISKLETPEFIRKDVIITINKIINDRPVYLAERIDAAFKMLSPNHITNSKWGFSERMIVEKAFDKWGDTFNSKMGKLDDLRAIIGAILNRNEISQDYRTSSKILAEIYKINTGKWIEIDGGIIRLKVFKKGTFHMDIHPEVAARLNAILAILHPNEIPSASFQPRKNPVFRDIATMRFLDPKILNALSSARVRRFSGEEDWVVLIDDKVSSSLNNTLREVFTYMGARFKGATPMFDYNPEAAIKHIIVRGCLPDWRTHQFYPTQEELSSDAAALLDVIDDDICLEPSAGHGGLAKHLNDNTTCVELSTLNCKILTAKGYTKVVDGDFIHWADKNKGKLSFTKILMNPPFTKNQAKSHVLAASELLSSKGKLVAILPSSLKNKIIADGFFHIWSETYQDQFDGTDISVCILTLTREEV